MVEYIETYPPLTNILLKYIVRAILTVGTPLKIILFGTQARNESRPDSDLDLLIVEDSELPRYKRPVRYLQALIGLYPEKDVVVWTPVEIREWENVPNAFINTILKEGITLYESPF